MDASKPGAGYYQASISLQVTDDKQSIGKLFNFEEFTTKNFIMPK